jgi:diguanylate cyclase (GGDEF)-like protein
MITIPDPSLLYDPLTGLVGPNLFQDRLHMAMARARRHSCSTALMILSIDDFRRLTDNGEDTDAILREAGRRIRRSLRTTDTVGRVEGEEFGVILEDLLITDNIQVVVDKLVKLFDDPVNTERGPRTMTVSLGVATFPFCGDDNETMISRAYSSLRKARERRGSAYEIAPYESQLPRRQLG